MFLHPIAKYAAIGLAGGALLLGFVLMNLHSESVICHDNGFGDYDDFTGTCKVISNYASNLVIVAGNTANSPIPQYNKSQHNKTYKDSTYNYLKNSIARHANIKVISAATGNPVSSIEIIPNTTNDAAGFVKSVEQTIEKVNAKISEVPSSDGATYLEAISKAGRDAVTAKKSDSRQTDKDDIAAVVVFGSGLSDGGVLNFADDNLLSKDTTSIIDSLNRTNELARDIDGIKITWTGIGQVATPQVELSNSEINHLKDIYIQILEKRGASIYFDDTALSNVSISNNHHTVKTTSTVIDLAADLLFRADSAELTDEHKTKSELSDFIDKARANTDHSIIVTGYMASGNCDGRADIRLAGARAETVKQFLAKNGVSNNIEAKNGGVFEPEKSECDAKGWNSALAYNKRKVTLELK